MSKKVKTRIVNLSLMLKVSRYGSGLYMRIPSDIARALMVKRGDLVQLKVEKIIEGGDI